MTAITIDLPWPPSQNRIWRSRGKRVYRDAKYVAWLEQAGWLVKAKRFPKIMGEFGATIILNPPNNRKIDLDNRIKVILDIAQKTGLIENDHFCRLLVVSYGEGEPKGMARLTLSPM